MIITKSCFLQTFVREQQTNTCISGPDVHSLHLILSSCFLQSKCAHIHNTIFEAEYSRHSEICQITEVKCVADVVCNTFESHQGMFHAVTKRLIIFKFTYFPPWQCHSAEQEVDPECSFSLCYGLSPCPSLGPSLCFGCDVRCRDVVSAVCSSEPLMPSASEHVYGLYNELQPDSREKQKEWKEYNTFIELLTFTETCRHLHQSWDFMTLSKITIFPHIF